MSNKFKDKISKSAKRATKQSESALVPSSGSTVTPVDGEIDLLKSYMKEVQKYKLLDPEEERELAQKMIEDGDLDAAKALVQANLRLVVKIAWEYRTAYQNTLDLIQEGNVGLMKAVSKFDPDAGARLASYASWWIRSYILKYILDNFRLVKIGTTSAQKKLFFNLMREKESLEAQGEGFQPKLIADKLGVKESEVIEMDKRISGSGGSSEVSLEAPISDGADNATVNRLSNLEDEGRPVDEVLESEELKAILTKELENFSKDLSEREQKILSERILSEVPQTLQQLADQYGISRERARQIEARVIEKLKDHLKDYFA